MKNQLNNKKGQLIKGKIAKSSVTFRKNKPNLSEDEFCARHFSTRIYERFHPLAGRKNKPNQTQYKPNSNPICQNHKMNLNVYYKKVYNKNRLQADKKQTQFKPKTKPVLSEAERANKIALNIYPFGIDYPIVFTIFEVIRIWQKSWLE